MQFPKLCFTRSSTLVFLIVLGSCISVWGADVTRNTNRRRPPSRRLGHEIEVSIRRQVNAMLPVFSARVWAHVQLLRRELKEDTRNILLLLEEHSGVGVQQSVQGSTTWQRGYGHVAAQQIKDNVTSALQKMERHLQDVLSSMSDRCGRSIEENNGLVLSQQGTIMKRLEDISKKLDDTKAKQQIQPPSNPLPLPVENMVKEPVKNCWEAKQSQGAGSYIIQLTPENDTELQSKEVLCDQETEGGGWTVILHRQKQGRQENFRRDWQDYEQGFGDAKGEFWIGLKTLHLLTVKEPHELRVEVSIGEERAHSVYKSFRVGAGSSRRSGYKLRVGDFVQEDSTAGDAMSYHDGMQFSTYDSDNDNADGDSCTIWCGGGGWWYNYCFYTNPTGVYPPDTLPRTTEADVYIEWRNWQGYHAYLTQITFMIRPLRS